MDKLSKNDVSDKIRAWVSQAVGSDAKVKVIQQLPGSTSSLLHQMTLERDQDTITVVIRQFNNVKWLAKEPDLARHEAANLQHVWQSEVSTPKVMAFDEFGKETGDCPAIVMSMLDGFVDLTPSDPIQWLDGLAKTLSRIHNLTVDNYPWNYFSYNNPNLIETQSWSTMMKEWDKAIDIVKGPAPAYETCFIHRDYHPCNVLWKNGEVSGVVDWVNACKGPAGADVGHCRLNLALLYGVETADLFLEKYRNYAAESFTYDPYWDLVSLIDFLPGPPKVYPGWPVFGMKGLTDKLMAERMDYYLISLLKHYRN